MMNDLRPFYPFKALLLGFLLLMSFGHSLFAQSCDTTFLKRIGNSSNAERAFKILPTPDGNFLIGGSKSDASLLMMVTPTGNILWERSFDLGAGNDFIFEMMLDTEGKLVAVGRDEVNPAAYCFAMRYDYQTHTVLWSRKMSSVFNPHFEGLLELPNGNFMMYGTIQPSGGAGQDNLVLDMNRTTGASTWLKSYNNGNTDIFADAIIKNGVCYTANNQRYGSGLDKIRAAVSKLDLSGNQVWTNSYIKSQSASARMYGVSINAANDTLVVFGHGNLTSSTEIGYSFQLFTTDLNGNIIWAKNYQLNGTDHYAKTAIPVPGGYILQGYFTKNFRTEMAIIKVNKQGDVQWAKAIGGPENEVGYSIALQGNHLYFAGYTDEFDVNNDIFFGKMSLNGEIFGSGCSYIEDVQVTTTTLPSPYSGSSPMNPLTANYAVATNTVAPVAVVSSVADLAGCGCETPGVCNNIISNTGYEAGLTGWSTTGNVSTTTDAHSGTSAAIVCGSAAGSIGQLYPATMGDVFSASFWAKSLNPPSNAFAQLRFLNGAFNPISTGSDQVYFISNNYQHYNLNAIAPSGTAYVHFLVWKQGSQCAVVDDVEVCKQNAATGLPDLTVSNVTLPTINSNTVQAGLALPVAFSLSNIGNSAVQGSVSVNIYVSNTPTLTQNSVLVKNISQQGLATGASVNLASNPVLPNSLTPGSYYVIVAADPTSTITESNETNNIAISQAFTVYGSCAMVANVTQVWCNDNGTGISTDDLTNFTISALNTIQTPGYYLNVQPVNQNFDIAYGVAVDITNIPISAGNLTLVLTDAFNPSCTQTLSVTAPQTCSAGLPDLVPSNLTAPTAVNANASYPFSFTVTNNSNVPASSSSELNNSLYLSTDNQFDNTDVYVGGSSASYNFPANSQKQYGPLNLLIPTVSAGNYFLILVIDQSHKVAESDEVNNIIYLPVTVQNAPPSGSIDLSLTATSPATAPIYTSYPTAIKVTNSGSIPATGVKVVCQKPNGVVYTGGNEFTASQGTFEALTTQVWTVGTLAPGASATLTVNYFLLQATLPAVYTQVTAANETDPDSTPNNGTPPTPNEDDEASSAGTTPPPPTQPDLTLTDLNAPASTPPGPATFTFTLKNVGNAAVQSNYQIGVFLSTDNVLSADDYAFTAISEQTTAVGSFNRTGSITTPTGQAGNYFLIVKADAGNTVAESNEGNNTVFRALTITGTPVQQPDLQLGSLNAPANFLSNMPTYIDFQLSNTGTVPVQGSFQTDIFLSTDNVISANDYLLLSMPEQNMIIGSVSRSTSISVGSAIPAGNYYLLLKVDGSNAIVESNENNNVSVQPITVTTSGGTPDCDAITITPNIGSITIAGVNAPHSFIKVFKPNWALAFECLDGSCASPQVVTGLGTGSHYVEVKLMNANWGEICTKSQNVGVSNLIGPKEDRLRLNFNRFYPNPAKYTVTMDVFSPKEQDATLDFYDQQGRLVESREVFLEEGQNSIEQFVFDWKSGAYNVVVRGEETALPAYGRFLKVWEE